MASPPGEAPARDGASWALAGGQLPFPAALPRGVAGSPPRVSFGLGEGAEVATC